MERLTALLKDSGGLVTPAPDVYIAPLGERAAFEGFILAERLRAKDLWVETGYDGASLRSQLRKADRLSVHYVLIIGDDELSAGKIKWKNLKDGSQGEAEMSGIIEFFSALLTEK